MLKSATGMHLNAYANDYYKRGTTGRRVFGLTAVNEEIAALEHASEEMCEARQWCWVLEQNMPVCVNASQQVNARCAAT